MSSIFGFYYLVGLLGHMGWPRRRSLFNSETVFNSIILDGAIDQMIDWSASIGACRPDSALQVIVTMFRENDWNSEDSLNIVKIVNDSKKLWNERGNNNPRDIVQPTKFSKLKDVISSKDLKNKDTQFLLEQYCFESLIWGLANPSSFKIYFETNEKRQKDSMPLYEKAGLEIDSIPGLDQILKEGEEILRGYEKEVRPLSPVPQKLKEDALSLGIKVNN
jgi:hypothetical protein